MQTNKKGSLQDKFQDFGAAPSEGLWNSIADSLDTDKRKRKGLIWWFFGSVAVLSLFFATYFLGYKAGLNDNNISHHKSTHLTEKSYNSKSKTILDSDTSPLLDNEKTVENNSHTAVKQPVLTGQSKPNQEKNLVRESVTQSFGISDKLQSNNSPLLASANITKLPISTITSIFSNAVYADQKLILPSIETRKKHGNWEMGFAIGTAVNPTIGSKKMTNEVADNTSFEFLPSNNITSSPLFIKTTGPKRPVQLEFTVGRRIGNRLLLQSGLSFSFLTAVSKEISSGSTVATSRFVSASIPMHLNYDFVKRKHFEIYTGLGLNAEFPFLERVKENSILAFQTNNVERNFISGFMGSFQLNTGFRYCFNENLKIDFKPFMRYYFYQRMNSSYPVLIEDRRLYSGASVGLTWSL